VLVLAACGGSDSDATEPPSNGGDIATAAVDISGFAFNPGDVTVEVGAQVTWTNNESGVPHTVTADQGEWTAESGSLGDGETFTFDFTAAGTYTYFCSIHPSMEGSITVSG